MRIEGWEKLLNQHIEASSRFEWGKLDCALWAATWIFIATGRDLRQQWLGKYSTEAGAARLMKKRGFAGVADIVSSHLPEIAIAFARRGDLVLHPDGPLGICNGRLSFFLAEDKVTAVPTMACPRAWKVD